MKIIQVEQVTEEIIEAFGRLIPQLSVNKPAPGRKELEEMVSVPGSVLFTARADDPQDKIMGVLALVVFRVPTGVHAWIEDVVVDEAGRGMGYGKALTQAAIEHAKGKGARSISLTSNPKRVAANRLYQSLGFDQPKTNYYRMLID